MFSHEDALVLANVPHYPSWTSALVANFCCVRTGPRKESCLVNEFEERNAMIMGMNPRELRKPLRWSAHLWMKRKRHWAIVLQPEGEPFQARIVDDFVYNATHCYNAEISSKNLFLVYEMLVNDEGLPYLMLSAKPDFETDRDRVRSLGPIGPISFEEIQHIALNIARRFRHYSLIGSNCQHFAVDFAVTLGVPAVATLTPDDEAVVITAADSAVSVGTAGAVVGVSAAAGAASVTLWNMIQPAVIMPYTPIVLKVVAVGATGVGVVASVVLVGIVAGYRVYCSISRRYDEPLPKAASFVDITVLHHRTHFEDEPASEPPTLHLLDDGTPLCSTPNHSQVWDIEPEEELPAEGPEREQRIFLSRSFEDLAAAVYWGI